ncbi:MAG: rRNA pseudouridine synthase [Ruminococcaceae bacterium]|nr:rRNA pseudouridine synthase [Oscillospiraceae bacterium]
MRLDKYLSEAAVASRSESSKAARSGKITVDGAAVKSAAVHIDPEKAVVYYCGKKVNWRKFTYVMLNKPSGVISSTDESGRTVMDILPPEFIKMNMFPCGRLDIDTTGLLLITNNGPLAHELLSPAKHVDKTYAYTCEPAITEEQRVKLEKGVDIGGHISAPAAVELFSGTKGNITIREGKFHQIKRMFEAVGSKITSLERIAFGPLVLDESLERGGWRYLTEEEEKELTSVGSKN